VNCWADSVPDEFQTPVFQGQLPPDQVFASTPVQSTGVPEDVFNEDVSGAEDSNGERAYEAEAASEYVHQTLQEADYAAGMEYNQNVHYDGYGYDQEYYYMEEPQQSSQFAPPPPPQQISEQDSAAAYSESMHRWYQHIVGWVDEALNTVGTALPPPPPPPNMDIKAHLRPYDFRQWCSRIEHWHKYVVNEFYYNVINPEVNMSRKHSQPPRQSPVPQPSYAYQSPQPRYQEPEEYPPHSYAPQYQHQHYHPATYQHNPYDASYQQGHTYGGYYPPQEDFPQLPPAADQVQYRRQSTRA